MIEQIFSNPLYCLPLTIGIYLLSVKFYAWVRIRIFHPLAITIALLIIMLIVTKTDYEVYKQGSYLINFLLGPSVVALGYVLYEQSEHLKGRVLSILTTVFIGAFVGIISAAGIAYLMGADKAIAASLGPRSVTTPIAIVLSEQNGGIPALTAVVVVVAGILGGLIGPPIFKLLKIDSRIARGLALGASAHGVGTSVAIQLGAVEGALGGLAIGIMGIWTSLLLPVFQYIINLL